MNQRTQAVTDPATRIRVLIVDDEPLARAGLRRLVARDRELEIIGECGDGLSALTAIQDLRPDLLLLDIQMPELNGFEVLRALGWSSRSMTIDSTRLSSAPNTRCAATTLPRSRHA